MRSCVRTTTLVLYVPVANANVVNTLASVEIDISSQFELLLFVSYIAREWRCDHEILLLLWKIHTTIVFHATWRLRSDIYFGVTQAVAPTIANLHSSFRSHFLPRHSSDWNIDGEAINRVLTRLVFELNAEQMTPNLLSH
ncbi:LOW QUALITY PROTEIN: Beta-glucosidase [Phytophthora palmivora]|uniref:Beta-glucosidase n=1 Tax=Phytophthora palmivora TaxID=4796 RepID=A0A2P4XIX0_9STRA|nr:LOW QUALITY PROTEIN: Beta-glucosidase [Phytophthora palmivora]